ncbi:hypothetical protein PG984_011091 [Apiospora sp. TS-2023a]
MEFRPDYNFEQICNDVMKQAAKDRDLQVAAKQRSFILKIEEQIRAEFRRIEEEADEELQTNVTKIRNDYDELIKRDRHLDPTQLAPLFPEQVRFTGPSEHEPNIANLESGPSSPVLGRETTLMSPEVKDSTSTSMYIPEHLVYWLLTYISERSRSFGSLPDGAHSGSVSRNSTSREPLHKKSRVSPGTVQQSDSVDSDSTGDFDEELPSRVPSNTKNMRSCVTPDLGVVDQANGPASSIQAVSGSFLPSSLPRPKRSAANQKNYNEKKYFKDRHIK